MGEGMSIDTVTAYVLGDIALILALSSLLGALARRCGQPTVIGQILTGVVAGPTVLGRLPGHLTSHLFPHQVISYLTVLASVAVVMFMFVVGYEIDFRPVRGRMRAISLIAAMSLIVPMAMGMGSVFAFRGAYLGTGQDNAGDRSFILYMGVVVSITALPVLASIVRERGLAGTVPGVIATSAAGVMDVAAWLALAAAVAGVSHAGRPWFVTLLIASGFCAVLLLLARPALAWAQRRSGVLASSGVPMAIVLAMGAAWVTARLGLHPVFGGFLAGLTLRSPDGTPDVDVLRFADGAASMLLPLFFVVAGLSLDLGALKGANVLLLALIILIAALGKLVPAYAGARLGGCGKGHSATIAALLNTRGLTELIALNVGLTAGLIGPSMFTILVAMALVTTIMTAPLLALTSRAQQRGGGAGTTSPDPVAACPGPAATGE
jgi:K+:H+ antiporter